MAPPSDDTVDAMSSSTAGGVLRRFAPHPYQSLDEAGRIITVNEAWLDVLGYDRDDVEGERFATFLTEEYAEGYESHFEAFKREGRITDVEFELHRADGDAVMVSFDGVIEYDDEGTFQRTHCQFTEVTERTEQREEIERTNTILTTLLENLPFGVLIEDADREIIGVNAAFDEVFDLPFPADQLIGEDCAEMAHETKDLFERPEAFIGNIETLLEDREPELREPLELADGRVLERTYIPYTLPEGEANFWIYRDVTDHTKRERALESLHESTRNLLDAEDRTELAERTVDAAKETLGFPISVVRFHSKESDTLQPVAVTPEAREMLGDRPAYQVGEGTAGRAFERGDPLVIDDLREWNDGFERKHARSAMYLPIGSYGILSIGDGEVAAFERSDVQLASILATNAEAALRRMDRERDLHHQNERLEEFASIVSHDLRSPLNVASGRLEMATEDCDSDHLDHVETALSRMEKIVEDTLTLARQGKAVGETEPVEVEQLVTECWGMVDTAGATLTVADSFTLEADRNRLRHLFENLFRNAVEHGSTSLRSQAHGDAVEHGSTNPRSQAREDAVENGGDGVTVTIGRSGETAFYVEDDGPGIPPEERAGVFAAGTSTRDDGTGFGLAIVRRIAEAHGWGVDVSDGAAGGARFEFTGVEIE